MSCRNEFILFLTFLWYFRRLHGCLRGLDKVIMYHQKGYVFTILTTILEIWKWVKLTAQVAQKQIYNYSKTFCFGKALRITN